MDQNPHQMMLNVINQNQETMYCRNKHSGIGTQAIAVVPSRVSERLVLYQCSLEGMFFQDCIGIGARLLSGGIVRITFGFLSW